MGACSKKMINETEIKILNVKPKQIRKNLKENKAEFVKKVFLINTMYANTHTKKDKVAVRIREERNKTKKTFTLTIKGPKKIINNCKTKKEYELILPSYEFGDEMLKLQGFNIIGKSEMKREYHKLKNCSVEIIELPKIPIYIEIEGEEKNILKVAKILGYSEIHYENRNILKIYNVKTNFLEF